MTDCPVCPVLTKQLELLIDLLNAERAEKHELLKQLVNIADPQALARLRGPQPVKPGEKRDVPIMSPSIARATLRDIPSPDEIAQFDAPAADRRDIEASFTKTGT